jgi:hypothetical protein
MAKKVLPKHQTVGIVKAVTDSTQAKSSYDREYNKRLNDPNSEPFSKERLEYYQRKFDKPEEIRSKIPVKKSSRAMKKMATGGEQDSSRKFKIGKTTISSNKKTVPGNASFPSMTKKSVGITRIGKGITFEKDKLGNGSYGKSITRYSTVKKTGGSIKSKKK